MKSRLNLFLILTVFSISCFTQVSINNGASNSFNHTFRYTNPVTRDTTIEMRDHCIIKVDSQWFCTGTSLPVSKAQHGRNKLLSTEMTILNT